MGQKSPINKDSFEPITQEQLDRAKPLAEILEEGTIRNIKFAKRIFLEEFPRSSTTKH